MDVNLPVWDYYPSDGKFIDPMYAPYGRVMVRSDSEQYARYGGIESDTPTQEFCPMNKWPHQTTACNSIYPEHVRKGLGLKFQKKHSWYPCPVGYKDIGDGFCAPTCQESEPIFYTDKSFTVRPTYFGAYGECPPKNKDLPLEDREFNEFDQKSVNPFTGLYQTYFKSRRSCKYIPNPSRNSYMA
jgi:hypothetical protein